MKKKLLYFLVTIFFLCSVLLVVFSKAEKIQNLKANNTPKYDINKDIKVLEKYIESKPQDTKILLELGLKQDVNKQPDKAIEIYQKVLQIEPNNSTALFRIGNIKLDAGMFNDAFSFYDQCSKTNPDNPVAYLTMSHILLLTDNTKALEFAQKAYDRRGAIDNPKFIENYLNYVSSINKGTTSEKYNAFLMILTDYINYDKLKKSLSNKIIDELTDLSPAQKEKLINLN